MNPPTIASDTLVEAIARAIFAAQWEAGPMSEHGPPDFGRGGFKTEVVSWQAAAQAALTAITEAGFVVCPREPTEAMTVLMAEAVEAATEIIADGNFDRPARLQALAAHAAFIDAATNNGKAE